jgi:ATP-binding cassette, subfamily B, bacterial PglK
MSTPSILSAIQKLRMLLTREEKWKWLGILGFALCTSVLEVITASVIILFAQVLNQPEAGLKYTKMLGLGSDLSPGKTVFYISVAFGGVYLIKNIIAACEIFYQNLSIQKMNYSFKEKLLNRYSKIDYNFYLTRNSSYGANVVGGDVDQTFSSGMVSLATILSESLVFLFLISTIVYVNPSLAMIIVAISGFIGFAMMKWFLPAFYRWGQKMQHASMLSSQTLYQFFHAFKEISLLGKRKDFIEAYQYHARDKAKTQAIQIATNSLPRMIIEVLFVVLFVFTIAYLCLDHETPQQMLGLLGGYLYLGFRLMPGLNRVVGCLSTFKYHIPSIERAYDEYTVVADKENYIDEPDFQFNTSIFLDNISFRYLNTQTDTLKGISLTIKKGECIGIVGETGSGKSTLVDLILGLLRPHSGTILIDNKHAVNSYQWHQHIGYVPQAVYLMDDTIEANIAFGDKPEVIDTKRLNKAIDDAQLRKFITQLPDGVKTIVGERGVRLSGGERQRIAIARALYRNPEVLIFDEATSALDNETEALLMETIQMVSKHRTVIMIAHRLTTLKDCDRIIMMENGLIDKITKYDQLEN